MTLFDYLVLIILLSSIIISMMRGLIKEILSLLSWVVAFVLANAYSETLASWLPMAIPGQIIRLMVAFIALFIGVRIIMALITKAIDSVIKASGLSLADRGLGGLFGFARGCLLILAAVLLAGMTSVPQQAFWRNALFSPLAETAARTVMPLLPNSVASHIRF